MNPLITITRLAGFGRGQSSRFNEREISLGTAPETLVRFDATWDKGVMKRHARLVCCAGQLWVESKDGECWLEGRRVTREALTTGVTLSMGQDGPRIRVDFDPREIASVADPIPASSTPTHPTSTTTLIPTAIPTHGSSTPHISSWSASPSASISAGGASPSLLGQSWDALTLHLGTMVGASLMALVVLIGLELIPVLGAGLTFIGGPLLFAGLCWISLRVVRGETPSIADAFEPITRCPVQIILGGLAQKVLLGVASILLSVFVCWILWSMVPEMPSWAESTRWLAWGGLGVVGLILFLPVLYLWISWIFTEVHMVDQRLDFWSAMEASRKQVASHFKTVLIAWLLCLAINLLGSLLLGIGLLISIPLSFLILAKTYEKLQG